MESGIHTAECATFMEKMEEKSVNLVVTSPPYDDLRDYKGFTFDCEAVATGLYRVVKDGGVVVWVVGDRINGGRTLTSFEHAFAFRKAGFTVYDVMIFKKRNTPFMRKRAYINCYEFMFVFSKGTPTTFNPLRSPSVRSGPAQVPYLKGADGINRKKIGSLSEHKVRTNIWSYAVGKNGTTSDMYAFKHPAMFPENLARDHILSWSNRGDLVFDPMCGAGTTCKMAKATGRRWLGVDVSREYTSIAERRVNETEEDSVSPPESRADPLDEPVGEDESVAVCRWCEGEIPAARSQATGGRAVTCSHECSLLNRRRRRHELKAEDRAKEKAGKARAS
ncbi:MAG: site-specific DNA-methyltransferase [Gemmatimonadetes bacterium]|nr:site-specific DNA-methyltransferase [Gemmatimonadota bacterium]